MPYITSVERIGIEKGVQRWMQQGIQHGESPLLERQLTRRFGAPHADKPARPKAATLEQLEQWAENILDILPTEQNFAGLATLPEDCHQVQHSALAP